MERLAVVTRGQLVESEHWGDLAVADAAGRLIVGLGEPERRCYLRSSAKPFQALSLVASGAAEAYGLGNPELAIAQASHYGRDRHVEAVQSLLAKAGVPEDALQCGTHRPISGETARALIEAGDKPRPIHNNCSGKHAAMLATAQHLGADLDTYLELQHPVQQQILANMELLTDVPRDAIVIGSDGCSAPVHGLPLQAMATAYARFAACRLPGELAAAAERLAEAMAACPHHIAREGVFNSRLLAIAGSKLVAKGGAEALFCVGHRQHGLGLAIRIRDGGGRAQAAIVTRALTGLNWLALPELEQLSEFVEPPVKNCRDEVVGGIRALFEL
jgi:L-asparaginase II